MKIKNIEICIFLIYNTSKFETKIEDAMDSIKNELIKYSNIENVEHFKYFHKTNEGGYAQYDKFLAVNVPNIRKVAKNWYKRVTEADIENILHSKYHEERLCALLMLSLKYNECLNGKEKEAIVKIYLRNTKYINGWDLVDLFLKKKRVKLQLTLQSHVICGNKELLL